MSLWKIRVAMADEWRSQELLAEALAGQRVRSRLAASHDTGVTVEMIIELTDVTGLSALLGELHLISRQVFVSSVDESSLLEDRPHALLTALRRGLPRWLPGVVARVAGAQLSGRA